jgi:hypothetical protein
LNDVINRLDNLTQKNVWGRLVPLCATVHRLLYLDQDTEAARKHLPELKRLLDAIPKNDGSIVGAEGRALYHELCGHIKRAIAARLREVELTEKSHDDIRRNKYPEKVKRALLKGRGRASLRIRRRIIAALRSKLIS